MQSAPAASITATTKSLSNGHSVAPMLIRRALSIVLKNVIVFLMVEGTVNMIAELGWLNLPSSEIDGFDRMNFGENAPAEKRLYQSDRNLIVRMRPNARITYNRNAGYPGRKSTYEVVTSAQGFRTPPFSESKKPGVFRVVCLGDSSTFGFNVEAADAYPQVLARLLEQSHPGRFEVLNLGVPGHSSRQGLELLRQEVLRYDPDLVTFAFGTNDRFWHRPLSDDAIIRLNQSRTGGFMIATRQVLDHVHTYRLMKRLLTAVMYRFVDPGALAGAGPPRVPLDGMRDNIAAAHALRR